MRNLQPLRATILFAIAVVATAQSAVNTQDQPASQPLMHPLLSAYRPAGLEGNEFSVDTLFIDEGFGALDADTLDIAITALETLHGQGRKVGVITHVAAMIESIPVQVKVEKLGGGSSIVRLNRPVLSCS